MLEKNLPAAEMQSGMQEYQVLHPTHSNSMQILQIWATLNELSS